MNKERKLKLSILYDPEELDSSYESDSSLEMLPKVDSSVSVLEISAKAIWYTQYQWNP